MSVSEMTGVASVKDQVSEAEWEQRVNLAALYRLVALHGWDDFLFTHLSARVPGPEHHFLINPFGMLFEEVTASSLVKVDVDGNKVMESAYDVNPAGFTIHSAVHMAREDAMCVMHLHTDDGVAVSAMTEGLMPITQHAMQCGTVAYHDYEGVALDLDERERIVADLGDAQFMLLRNHGTLTTGPSCAAAFMAMYYLERACTMQVRALAGGGTVNMPPQGSAEKAAQQSKVLFDGTTDDLTWPAWLRKLDAVDSSFRN
ncbi:MAG: class II aldolase/adducin family protein [Pseudomonadales bacterium]|jgi:ribulose-5-phosphate 4-epimerase/fuculose-1-phosphate aldolase|nr:class II aldolase/adducin family protein [Pseudomonadales bacterium]